MKGIIRFTVLNIFVLCFVVLVELLLVESIFSSPTKIKSLLADANAYHDLTAFINQKMQEQDSGDGDGDGNAVSLSESAVQQTAESVIDQTWNWASGKTSQAPVITISDLFNAAGVNQADMAKYAAMEKDLSKTMTDPDFQKQLPPQSQQAMKQLQNFTNNGNSFSLEKYLSFVKKMVTFFKLGIPILGVISLLCLALILLLSPTNQSRAMWLFFTFLLTSLAFLVIGGIFAIPKLLLPIIIANMQGQSSYGTGILQVIVAPISSILFHEHVAFAVGIFCLAVVCLLARIMVFNQKNNTHS